MGLLPGKRTKISPVCRILWTRGVDRGRGVCLSEYVEFAGAMVLFVGILVGSYWFVVIGPGRNRKSCSFMSKIGAPVMSDGIRSAVN